MLFQCLEIYEFYHFQAAHFFFHISTPLNCKASYRSMEYHIGSIFFSLKNAASYNEWQSYIWWDVRYPGLEIWTWNCLGASLFLPIYPWLLFLLNNSWSICLFGRSFCYFTSLPSSTAFFPASFKKKLPSLLLSLPEACTSSQAPTDQSPLLKALQPGGGATKQGESWALHLLALWDPACTSWGGHRDNDAGYLAPPLRPLATAPAHSILQVLPLTQGLGPVGDGGCGTGGKCCREQAACRHSLWSVAGGRPWSFGGCTGAGRSWGGICSLPCPTLEWRCSTSAGEVFKHSFSGLLKIVFRKRNNTFLVENLENTKKHEGKSVLIPPPISNHYEHFVAYSPFFFYHTYNCDQTLHIVK